MGLIIDFVFTFLDIDNLLPFIFLVRWAPPVNPDVKAVPVEPSAVNLYECYEHVIISKIIFISFVSKIQG